ncbi:MAG: glycosyltransferase [Peptostreptococcus sp.]|uniref:glycosyltransferase n=1 Tax=Peptostreptococcus sp. TaxID=1262 RepID=UPI000763C88A|nr:glycosyltransferase [Peptostreptococcus sp.]MDU5350754.1 glycosyltransferase [Peptostreptococcus sp.]MDU5890374.1 glycosyltransferase [Peptostreptococcus sp.]MDU6063814.1 glycosyltransferase [Anaerococcus sp.]
MKITAISLGSYGDVMPFIALGKELKRRGHNFQLATFQNFKEICIKNGIDFKKISGSPDELVSTLLSNSNNTRKEGINGIKRLLEQYPNLYKEFYQACRNSDLIIYMQFGALAYHFAEKFNIPIVRTFVFPFDPTMKFCSLMPGLKRKTLISYLGYYACYIFMSFASISIVNKWRERLGLKKWHVFKNYRKIRKKNILTLYQYDDVLAKRDESWGSHVRLTGNWIDECSDYDSYIEYQQLNKFLTENNEVIYVGFGSMIYDEMFFLYNIIIEIIVELQLYAVLPTFCKEIVYKKHKDFINHFYFIDYLPFNKFLKRFKLAIHHGGSGTVHSCLRNGIPQFILAFGADQLFWGQQCYELGIGPKPINIKDGIEKYKIKEGIVQIINEIKFKKMSVKLSNKVSKKGVVVAADIIEKNFEKLEN